MLTELAVRPKADPVGRPATFISFYKLFGINLLAIARESNRSNARLWSMPVQAGDVLLTQGTPEAISDFAHRCGCVPLAARQLRLPDADRASELHADPWPRRLAARRLAGGRAAVNRRKRHVPRSLLLPSCKWFSFTY
ncbi:MAG: hypothetical protein C0524_14145 [Rhodobacter sp.]|nr:hypothetical protein [Rhodobacter sp.]